MESPPPPRPDYAVPLLAAAACAAALCVHVTALISPFLYNDDFAILLQSYTWQQATADPWAPVNEHSWPLTRLLAWSCVAAAGRPSLLPLVAMLQTRVALLACMVLVYLFVRRERGHPFYGLVAMTVFGVTAVFQEAVDWYAASPALFALATALLTLLAAQGWRFDSRPVHLFVSAAWAALAPAWFAGGVLAGPLAALYLGFSTARGRAGRWAAVVPPLGTLAFLAVSLSKAGARLQNARHSGARTTAEAFDPLTGMVSTARSIVDNLILGAVGVDWIASPPAVVGVTLVLVTVAGFWWWRRAPSPALVVLGLGFILANDVLIYSARARWDYEAQLRGWSRYNVFPQLGVALIVCGGLPRLRDGAGDRLSRRQVRVVAGLIAVLLAVHQWRGHFGSPAVDFEQVTVFRRVEEVDRRCREHRISAADARAALDPLPLPGGWANAWDFLRASDDPRPVDRAEARRLLSR